MQNTATIRRSWSSVGAMPRATNDENGVEYAAEMRPVLLSPGPPGLSDVARAAGLRWVTQAGNTVQVVSDFRLFWSAFRRTVAAESFR